MNIPQILKLTLCPNVTTSYYGTEWKEENERGKGRGEERQFVGEDPRCH